MRALLRTSAAVLAVLLLTTCSKEKDKVFDNPTDPESPAYVGHEVRDPKDPINVPSVEITNAPTTLKINAPYTFVATASDPNPGGLQPGTIVRYDWDFGDGTRKDSASASEQHTYVRDKLGDLSLKTFSVRVSATDNDANVDTTSVPVVVTNFRPVADAHGPYTIKINSLLTLVGNASDPDGRVVSTAWDFNRDGAFDAVGDTATHVWAVSGPTWVRYSAMDDDGNVTLDSALVTVTNFGPVANAGGPYTVKINVPLTLNGSATDDGQVVKYEWDFDNDGVYDWNSATTGQTAHTYSTDGTKTVQLRVTDDDGNVGTAQAQVTVTNLAPVANAGGPYTVKINVPLTFNGSGTDDGQIVKYEWDFDGDGTWDWFSTTTGQTTHTYPTRPTRTHTAKLRVTDDDGNTNEKTVQVTVTNHAPVANPGGPYTGEINVPITFNGSGNDADGRVAKYEWDFDGDGAYDWSSTTTGATAHTYTVARTYSAALRITDDDGNTDVKEVSVPVYVPAYDLSTLQLERTLIGHTDAVLSVALSSDGQYIVSGSEDLTIMVWRVSDGSLVRTLSGHTGDVTDIEVTPDSRYIVSCSSDLYDRDNTIRVWNLSDGSPVRTIAGSTAGIRAIAITPDGQRVVAGGENGAVTVWNLATGSLERTIQAVGFGYVLAVAVSPNGQCLLAGGWDKTIGVWRISDGSLVRTIPGHTSWVEALALTDDGDFVISGSSDHTVRIWRFSDGSLVRTLAEHTNSVEAVAADRTGQYVLSGDYSGNLIVWRLSDGSVLKKIDTYGVSSVAITPDGQRVITGHHYTDNKVRVWRAQR